MKIKKAKVVVPALALLCFSTVASVTGTVAWFGVRTSVTVTTTSFKVKALGDLSIALTAGVGTTVTNDDTTYTYTVAPATYGSPAVAANLTHGSVDPANQKGYVVNYVEDGDGTEDDYLLLGTGMTKANESAFLYKGTSQFICFSWDMTFTFNYGEQGDTPNYDLFFDEKGSTAVFTQSKAATTTGLSAERGFRAAFLVMNSDASAVSDWFVWSPHQGLTLEQNTGTPASCFVSSTTGTTAYTASNLLYKSDVTAANTNFADKLASTAKGDTSRVDYLGTFTSATLGTTNVKTVRAVVWYEGEDINVSNGTALGDVASSFKFYVRESAAA